MTRKDFVLIAECLNDHRAELPLVQTFADRLATTNPLFSRATFVAACFKWQKGENV